MKPVGRVMLNVELVELPAAECWLVGLELSSHDALYEGVDCDSRSSPANDIVIIILSCAGVC